MDSRVLIVGAGPVGLTMAAELVRYRVPVRIIDQNAKRTELSKALVVWSRTLELLDRMGIADRFVTAGFKVHAATLSAGSQKIATVGFDELQTPYPCALMLPQSDTERLMEDHQISLGVHVERQTKLHSFSTDDQGITVELSHVDAGNSIFQTPWLIGCDGAHSSVRHGLKLEFEGHTMPSDFILGDVHLENVPIPANELGLFFHADGLLALFPIAPPRYRMIADIGDGKSDQPPHDPTLEDIQRILDNRGPGGMRASHPIWLSAFRINERKVKDYRAGRIFLVGDAAHVHSPAGGQGMNTGMQDACNLAWKLAMVWHGQANEKLLESYSIERSEVGRMVLKDAGRLTTIGIMKGQVRQAIRNHVARLALGFSAVRDVMANKLSELAVDYPHSPLSATHHPMSPAPGERVPMTQGRKPIGDGRSPRFVLFAADDDQARQRVQRFSALLEPAVRPPLSENGIWLVRPDEYVSVTAAAGDWVEVDRMLESVST